MSSEFSDTYTLKDAHDWLFSNQFIKTNHDLDAFKLRKDYTNLVIQIHDILHQQEDIDTHLEQQQDLESEISKLAINLADMKQEKEKTTLLTNGAKRKELVKHIQNIEALVKDKRKESIELTELIKSEEDRKDEMIKQFENSLNNTPPAIITSPDLDIDELKDTFVEYIDRLIKELENVPLSIMVSNSKKLKEELYKAMQVELLNRHGNVGTRAKAQLFSSTYVKTFIELMDDYLTDYPDEIPNERAKRKARVEFKLGGLLCDIGIIEKAHYFYQRNTDN